MTDQTEPAGGAVERTVTGKVISSAMNKTITVAVERLLKHPRYGKYIRRTSRIMAHDENNECGEGDMVAIVPCRPLSKRKAWRLVRVIEPGVR